MRPLPPHRSSCSRLSLSSPTRPSSPTSSSASSAAAAAFRAASSRPRSKPARSTPRRRGLCKCENLNQKERKIPSSAKLQEPSRFSGPSLLCSARKRGAHRTAAPFRSRRAGCLSVGSKPSLFYTRNFIPRETGLHSQGLSLSCEGQKEHVARPAMADRFRAVA